MPNMPLWFSVLDAIPARAADAWKRINDKPSSIVLVRKGTARPAQTVRVEYDRGTGVGSEVGDAGKSSRRGVIVFGIRGHETLPDTDIQRGDQFTLDGAQFKVIDVVHTLGEIQASCEAQR
jgi:hypothetical protein